MKRFGVVMGMVLSVVAGCKSEREEPSAPEAVAMTYVGPAAPKTTAEIGVIEWYVTMSPNGAMVVAGIDGARRPVVEFATTPSRDTVLRDAMGVYQMKSTGEQANTIAGNPRALRTLELLSADLGPASAVEHATTTPQTIAAGVIQPTWCPDWLCDAGDEVVVPGYEPDLVDGDGKLDLVRYCSTGRFNACKGAAGSLAAARSDAARACSAQTGPRTCDSTQIDKWLAELDQHDCTTCADQWNIDPNEMLHCSGWVRTDNWLPGVSDTCEFPPVEYRPPSTP